MIPLSDQPRERRRLFPLVVVGLVAANVLAFLYVQLFVDPALLPRVYQTYGVVPARLSRGLGAPEATAAYPYFTLLTLLTSMFLHGGWLHIAGNMLFLWIFGDNVESAMGHLRFLVFYLVAGVGAALAQVAVDPASRVPAVGASGSIAGVLGAYVLFYPQARVRTLVLLVPFVTVTDVSAFVLIGLWIVLQVVSGLSELGVAQSGGVAYFAHIGGFVVGLVLANLFRSETRRSWR